MMVTVHTWTRDQIIAHWRAVVVQVFRVDTTLRGIQATQDVFDSLARQHPGGLFVLTIVEEAAPLPAPDVRAMVARFLLTRAPQILLSAVVYEGSGFRAGAVRSLVNGLALVSRLPYRHKIFATVEDAAGWFAQNASAAREWGPSGLVDAVREIRDPAPAKRA